LKIVITQAVKQSGKRSHAKKPAASAGEKGPFLKGNETVKPFANKGRKRRKEKDTKKKRNINLPRV